MRRVMSQLNRRNLVRRIIILVATGFFLTGCAGEKVDPLDGPPGGDLTLELQANAAKRTDNEDEARKMEGIYERQLEGLQDIYWSRRSLSVAFFVLVDQQSTTGEQFQEVFDTWDDERRQYLGTTMDLEMEKLELLGAKDYKKLIKEEQDIIAQSMVELTGVNQ